jgi:hypothetical protein
MLVQAPTKFLEIINEPSGDKRTGAYGLSVFHRTGFMKRGDNPPEEL